MRKRKRRTQVLNIQFSNHRLAFVGDKFVSLDHDDIRREAVLAAISGGDYESECDCAMRFYAATQSLGCKRRLRDEDSSHENVQWDDSFPCGLRHFGYKERAQQWRLARAWRKRYNKRRGGRRVKEWWPKDVHPVAFRYLNFPMTVLKELRQRGLEATREGENQVGLRLNPSAPQVMFSFYCNSSNENWQTWTFNARSESHRLAGRTVKFAADPHKAQNGDLVIVQAADALEEMCLAVYQRKLQEEIMHKSRPSKARPSKARRTRPLTRREA